MQCSKMCCHVQLNLKHLNLEFSDFHVRFLRFMAGNFRHRLVQRYVQGLSNRGSKPSNEKIICYDVTIKRMQCEQPILLGRFPKGGNGPFILMTAKSTVEGRAKSNKMKRNSSSSPSSSINKQEEHQQNSPNTQHDLASSTSAWPGM